MAQSSRGGSEIEQRRRNMRLIGVAGAIGDLVIIAVFWLIPADIFPEDSLIIFTILLAASAVYLIWVTHIFLPKRWEKSLREPPQGSP